ncbi:MAG: RibD family protein [Dermatophilaceae bacterium]
MKVTVFSQVSLDGKLTLGKGGSSRELFTLLGEQDIRFVHEFRSKVDAIVVGRRTVSVDNPTLNNRYGGRSPVRVIPSVSLEFPESCNVLRTSEPTIVVTTEAASATHRAERIRSAGKEVLSVGESAVDFPMMLQELERRGMQHVMIEGGGASTGGSSTSIWSTRSF